MRTVGMALLGLASIGCAPARNFETADGPRYFRATVAPRPTPRRLRVVTFNIEFGRALYAVEGALYRVPALAGADFVLLQETDLASAQWLAERLGRAFVYVPVAVHPLSGTDYGNAILSRWPLLDTDKLLLPHRGRWRGNRRGATAATACVSGVPVRVYSAHLGMMTEAGPDARREQLGTVLDDADAFAVVIVGGDLNSGSVADTAVARGYAWPTRDQGATHGPWSFDHVLLRGITATGSGVVDLEEPASDHRPVWTELEFDAPVGSNRGLDIGGDC